MSWVLLPVNYTDAVWSGLKKFVMVNNEDNTVSFQDVTVYSQRENSFFGAQDANRMNEALNTIMSMVESGTDLYAAFQNYFAAQKVLFENEADTKQQGFEDYVDDLETEGDQIIDTLRTDYRADITAFESQQEQVFNAWFEAVRGRLNQDAAGELLNYCEELDARLTELEGMVQSNHYVAMIADEDTEDEGVLVDDDGYAILGEWIYKEV
ncbi:MAG: hypothetical protein J6D08_10975 [Lachnospiraceae bacterium]|jgi:hypothetical protein|nr:hypothetical protein [Lachnospiraceae bacterium]